MAHVGVLRVLEEMQVPVDVVVGTSAGSAVAALYATGMPVEEIEKRFIGLDWLSSFAMTRAGPTSRCAESRTIGACLWCRVLASVPRAFGLVADWLPARISGLFSMS